LPGQQRATSINSNPSSINNPNLFLQNIVGAAAVGATLGLISGNSNNPTAGITVGFNPLSGYNTFTTNPSINRLIANNLPPNGVYDNSAADGSLPTNDFSPAVAFVDKTDHRVIISDQTGLFISKSNVIFAPLATVGGVLFPYTPTISTTHKANYEIENLIQTNYGTPYYTYSTVDGINIQARLTAQTATEAAYMVAVIHFFRSATKMFYGASQNRGTPPPILYLDAHGQYLFDHVPVVVSSFQVTLPNDVNYITTKINKVETQVPIDLTVSLDLIPTYSRDKISNNFDLVKFSKGQLLTSGSGSRSGGWI
jgi:hypothetical protein